MIPDGARVNIRDGEMTANKYKLVIYFDVPNDFRTYTAEVECSSDVKSAAGKN